jgi:single-stranded-DNA-specific exonuclease
VGLTLDIQNLEPFRRRFEEVASSTITEDMLTPMIEVDIELHFDAINTKFLKVLKRMGPFGPENPNPVFMASNVYVFNSLASFKDRHLRFLVGQEGSDHVFQSVAFDLGENYERLSRRDLFQMAFTVEENTYNGTTTLQLRIKDIKFN